MITGHPWLGNTEISTLQSREVMLMLDIITDSVNRLPRLVMEATLVLLDTVLTGRHVTRGARAVGHVARAERDRLVGTAVSEVVVSTGAEPAPAALTTRGPRTPPRLTATPWTPWTGTTRAADTCSE